MSENLFASQVAELHGFFEYKHLPPHLALVSAKFEELASHLGANLAPSAETVAGFRKLLEAKDCFVRAALAEYRSADAEQTEEVL